MKEDKQDIFKEAAAIIGNVSPSLIEEIVNASNDKKLLYHGIKRSKNAEKIRSEGLKPLTTESGPCSFWSTGIKIFYEANDCPFFTYSGRPEYPPNPFVQMKYDCCELNLAITSYDLLKEKGLILDDYREDSQIKIQDTVPYDAMIILNVKVKHAPCTLNEIKGEHRRRAEQILVKMIEEQVKDKLSFGKRISKVEDFKDG